jgi:hypothetical protein
MQAGGQEGDHRVAFRYEPAVHPDERHKISSSKEKGRHLLGDGLWSQRCARAVTRCGSGGWSESKCGARTCRYGRPRAGAMSKQQFFGKDKRRLWRELPVQSAVAHNGRGPVR